MILHHLVRFDDLRFCSIGDMFLVCHLIKQDNVINTITMTITTEAPQISHQPIKFGDYRHCNSGSIMAFSLSLDLTRPCDQSVK